MIFQLYYLIWIILLLLRVTAVLVFSYWWLVGAFLLPWLFMWWILYQIKTMDEGEYYSTDDIY